MKKTYVKPSIEVVELRPDERISKCGDLQYKGNSMGENNCEAYLKNNKS